VPTILSLYTFHTSTRTLSNSTEAAFTITALYYWPLSLPEVAGSDIAMNASLLDVRSVRIAIVLLALNASLRPSNVLLSIPLVIVLVRKILGNITSTATALESSFAMLVVGRNCLAIG
jgi:hypothetical protein